jgi:hypothetical protein
MVTICVVFVVTSKYPHFCLLHGNSVVTTPRMPHKPYRERERVSGKNIQFQRSLICFDLYHESSDEYEQLL